MKVSTERFRAFTIELDDATFTFKPLEMSGKYAALAVLDEVQKIGALQIFQLSLQSRADLFSTVTGHITGWTGVKDEYGRDVPFEPAFIERHFDPGLIWQMFFRITNAMGITDTERKNSFTASKSESSAPVISTATSAESSVPTPAANPVNSNTEMRLATIK